MAANAPNSNRLWSDLLVEELVRLGVQTFCVAPGSRSTPLVAAVFRNPRARAVVHFDERGCGYFVLGHAKRDMQPAALVTTSGTAVANCMPAVVEASMSGVPMIVLTADRPSALRDTGANQTIEQNRMFDGYVRWFFELPPPHPDVDPALVLTTVDQAVHRARTDRGPVHLNLPFAEPLLTDAADDEVLPVPGIVRWRSGTSPYTEYVTPHVVARADQVGAAARIIRSTDHGVVIVGGLGSRGEAEAAARVAAASGWPVIVDVLSRDSVSAGPLPLVRHHDLLLSSPEILERLPPKAVLQVGERPVSKRLLDFVAAAAPQDWVVVDDRASRLDPHHRVTMRVEADIVDFCDAVAVEAASGDWAREDTTYTSAWLLASAAAAEAVAELTGGSVPTELDVARMITEETPRAGTVVVGNSMPVRDLDTHRNVQAELPMVVANRGASGIDGTLAAAAGVAFGAGSGTTVVLGDQAFLHDLNSLALVRKSPTPIIVVVINNDGGAIFSFLPVAEQEDLLESLFVAPHGLTFGDAARLFDLSYTRVESMSGIREAYRAAVRAGDTTVIEVPSDRERNRTIHLEIEAAVRERVTRALRSGKRDTIGEKNT